MGFGALDIEAIRPAVQTFARIVESVMARADSR
jgi:GntR family transcriptional regulator/MocR family aminotransferase